MSARKPDWAAKVVNRFPFKNCLLANEREAIARALRRVREEDAKIAEDYVFNGKEIAAAIRARGRTK